MKNTQNASSGCSFNFSKTAPQNASQRRRALPLALIIVRYFIYVLVATGFLALLFWAVLSWCVRSGVLYYSSEAAEQASGTVAALEEGSALPENLPSYYRWATFAPDGAFVAGDMEAENVAYAREAAFDGLAVEYNRMGGTVLYAVATLPGGNVCVLRYDYLADFVSKDLRDMLPPPEALLVGVVGVAFALTLLLFAMRAARVIARKMKPLTQAAEHIGRQELNFGVEYTNVREINRVAEALDRMRKALEESLRAQWATQEAQRNQVAALAHDLKTPLAVARWNADLLDESELSVEQRQSAEGVRESLARLEEYVALLVDASRNEGGEKVAALPVAELAREVEAQARPLCAAHNLALTSAIDDTDAALLVKRTSVVRAVMNLITNAVEYAPSNSEVSVRFAVLPCSRAVSNNEDAACTDASRNTAAWLQITVADNGAGFSPEALARGTERFFTTKTARTSSQEHYGLGLSIAADIAAAHGGALLLENAPEGGARVTLELPLYRLG